MDHPRNPEDKGDGDDERHAHADEPDAPSSPVDLGFRRNAVNGFEKLFPRKFGCQRIDFLTGDGQEPNDIEPIQPGEEFHLKLA